MPRRRLDASIGHAYGVVTDSGEKITVVLARSGRILAVPAQPCNYLHQLSDLWWHVMYVRNL